MTEEINVTLATADDAPAVLHFLKQVATESNAVTIPHLDQVTVAQEQENIELINQFDDCVMLLAMKGTEPVGIVTVMMLEEQPNVGELGVVVAQKYWRNGIGRLLVDEAEYWFENYSSLDKLVLTVFTDNQAAINLYKQLHFVVTKTTKEAGRAALEMVYHPSND